MTPFNCSSSSGVNWPAASIPLTKPKFSVTPPVLKNRSTVLAGIEIYIYRLERWWCVRWTFLRSQQLLLVWWHQGNLWHQCRWHRLVDRQTLVCIDFAKWTNEFWSVNGRLFTFKSSVRRWPLERSCWVEASISEPNWAKAATSRYWAKSNFMVPETCFMAFIWAAEPTRETERPTLMAGRIP